MSIKMRNNTARPYGYIAWQFEYDDDDHDHADKNFLGEVGDFNGEDVVDIICRQPATARFHSAAPVSLLRGGRVSGAAVAALRAEGSGGDRDNVAGVLRFGVRHIGDVAGDVQTRTSSRTRLRGWRVSRVRRRWWLGRCGWRGRFRCLSTDTYAAAGACAAMGQGLLNPPSVEGWAGRQRVDKHGGLRGSRVNFASRVLNDPDKSGLRAIVDRIGGVGGRRIAVGGGRGGRRFWTFWGRCRFWIAPGRG